MNRAEWIAVAALFVSIFSIVTTIYFNLRDRARLAAKSTFYPGWEGDMPRMTISIVNKGRRPAVLHMWGGVDEENTWVGTALNSKEGGLRLGEHSRYELRLSKSDLIQDTPEGEIVFKDIWFEDTLGRRHFVMNAKKHIALMMHDDKSNG